MMFGFHSIHFTNSYFASALLCVPVYQQYGETYQKLRCPPDEWFMECPPDPGMQVKAVAPLSSSDSVTGDDGSPPFFFCGARRYFPFTGYYDDESNIIRNEEPFANRAGRTDVEGW